MADLTEGQQNLLTIWGNIQQAVRDADLRARPGGVTQYVWEAFKQSYLARGENPPKATIQDMNRLMASAGRQQRADSVLSNAIQDYLNRGIDRALTSEMFAPDIDSRALNEQPLGPNYRIRFGTQMEVGGEQMDLTYTWSPGISPPTSISDLLGGLTEVGAGNADDYGSEFLGLTYDVSISTV